MRPSPSWSRRSITGCRAISARADELFEELERSALKPLPAEPYVFAEWKECRVGLDYHVEIEKHYYSVPHQLLREKVWSRITARTIEASPSRQARCRACALLLQPQAYDGARAHAVEPPALCRLDAGAAEAAGRRDRAPHLGAGRDHPAERTHPEQGFRACVGILRLVKTCGRERLEAACARALEIGARSYSSVNSILKNNLDRQRPATPADGPAIAHDNIRGPTYFH